MESAFYSLATKSNFNKALNHFYKVSEMVDYVDQKRNMADVINVQLDQGEIVNDQILPVVGSIIRDKFGYSYDSYNIPDTIVEFNKIVEETSKWTAMDILMVYYNPGGEVMLINPKNVAHFEKARELTKDQLLVIYTKFLKPEPNRKIENEAIEAIEEMIAGKDVFINKEFIDTAVQPKAQVRRPAPGPAEAGKKRITPKYSVQVTNELFHNGNVEAWKKIVESFKVSFPDLDVHIFYENEVINDINTLFKWGKVKSGNLIFFQVAGANIRGVSKLQKYLFEGASPRFEQFLKLGVGKVLNLF
jgi:hypothetical protein